MIQFRGGYLGSKRHLELLIINEALKCTGISKSNFMADFIGLYKLIHIWEAKVSKEEKINVNILDEHSFIHQWLYSPFIGPWPPVQFRNIFYTVGRTTWTSDQPVAKPLPTHRTTQNRINEHIHPCLEYDSNPRSQRSSERIQFMP
jgi:hypothetical protein